MPTNLTDGIIEKYMDYTTVNSVALNNYINMYGKDALYMVIDVNGNGNDNTTSDDIYIAALGRDNTSFDYSRDIVKKYSVKILVDYTDWHKSYLGESTDIMIYFSNVSYPELHKGDMLMHKSRGKENFYRVIDYADSFNSSLFKVNVKLIQSKDVGSKNYGKRLDIDSRGLII